jgi:glycosyltransferase involved in cell wall biosynthesis
VYLEAGSHYLPCVAGQGTGTSDAVAHNRTGLLVDPFDHVAVAEALTSLLLDPTRGAIMGLAGRRRAEEHSWGRMADSIDALLDTIVAGPLK